MNDISWDDNDTPVSNRFGDPYYSRGDGQAETRHVFLGGNDLPARWHDANDFTIGELGFGTGLNFLETLSAWNETLCQGSRLHYVSFERYPMAKGEITRALGRWDGLPSDTERLIERWPPEEGCTEISFETARLTLFVGNANDLLPGWAGVADAWYLDGFSPAKNPDLWGEDLMCEVARHTKPGGTFATYTAAGWVRRNLAAAGFAVEKMPGFGRKRECAHGRLCAQRDSTAPGNL